MICEICGAEVRHLTKVIVDRATLEVCDRCARFGKPVETPVPHQERGRKAPRRATGSRKSSSSTSTVEYDVVDGYGSVIRAARERIGLTQEELGKKVSEKASTIHRLESESLAPSIALARKLERFLKIRLLERVGAEEELVTGTQPSSEEVTLGEVIRLKKR